MTSMFDNEENPLPHHHYECKKCLSRRNLIRPIDTNNPTYCKDCRDDLKSNLIRSMNECGIKFLLQTIICAIENNSSMQARIFIANHLIRVLEDHITDWEYDDRHQ